MKHSMAVLLLAFAVAPTAFAATTRVRLVAPVPYEQSTSVNLTPPFVNAFAYLPTPANRRVMVETATIQCTTPSATDIFTTANLVVSKQLSTTSYQAVNAAFLALQRVGPGPFSGYIWQATVPLTAYSDAIPTVTGGGTGIQFNIFHTESSVAAFCAVTVSGQVLTLY